MSSYLDLDTSNGQRVLRTPATAGGGGSANLIPQLDGSGLIPVSMIPPEALDGVWEESVVLSETVAAGDLLNIYNNGGVLTARRAKASGPTPLQATAVAKTAGNSTDTIVAQIGVVAVTKTGHGFTLWEPLFLSTTAGAFQATPPNTSGQLVQTVGYAKTANLIVADTLKDAILLAT